MSATFTITLQGPPKVTTIGTMTQVIKQIDYSMTGTEGGETFTLPGTAVFPDPSVASFLPFASLNQAQVISWIGTLPDALSKQAHIQVVLDQMVAAAQLTPTAVAWAPQPVAAATDPATPAIPTSDAAAPAAA